MADVIHTNDSGNSTGILVAVILVVLVVAFLIWGLPAMQQNTIVVPETEPAGVTVSPVETGGSRTVTPTTVITGAPILPTGNPAAQPTVTTTP